MLSIVIILGLLFLALFVLKVNKNIRFSVATILFVLLVLEVCVYGYFLKEISKGRGFFLIGNQKILDQKIKTKMYDAIYSHKKHKTMAYQADDDLGYSPMRDYFRDGIRQTNSQGMRGDKEYSLLPLNNKLRIAAFGDSFVFGDGEKAQDVWPYILENSVKNLEVLNFGVSGYGLGQSYLRYVNDGLKYKPDIIFFNYIRTSERDRFRAWEIVKEKRRLTDSAMFRTRFWLEDGKLFSKSMTPFDLFDKQSREEYIYEPLGFSDAKGILASKLFSVSNIGLFVKQLVLRKKASKELVVSEEQDLVLNFKILENLLSTARQNNATVFFFIKGDFVTLPDEIKKLLFVYRDNVQYFDAFKLVGSRMLFHKEDPKKLMNHTGHFNRRGNEIYAETLQEILKVRNWGHGLRRFQYDEKMNGFVNLAELLAVNSN